MGRDCIEEKWGFCIKCYQDHELSDECLKPYKENVRKTSDHIVERRDLLPRHQRCNVNRYLLDYVHVCDEYCPTDCHSSSDADSDFSSSP